MIELQYNAAINPGKTLLFLDEIQAAPQVFEALRYFFEERPDIHVIAAGSLLEFALAEPSFAVPVGRIEYLYLGPMTFEKPSENSGFHPFCEEKSPDSSTSHPMKNARRTDRLDDP